MLQTEKWHMHRPRRRRKLAVILGGIESWVPAVEAQHDGTALKGEWGGAVQGPAGLGEIWFLF